MASILSKTQKKKDKYKLKDLKTLGTQLLSSRSHINNLPLLLTFVSPKSPPQYVLESILSLQSFFTPILPDLPPSSFSLKAKKEESDDKKKNDPELIYRTWLRSKFDEFVKLLIDVVVSSEAEETLRDIVLDAVMELVKMGKGGKFQSSIYHRLIHSIVNMPELDVFLLDSLSSKYFKYIDVRYFTFISLDKLARSLELKDEKSMSKDCNSEVHPRVSKDHPIHNIHLIISRIPPLESNNDKAVHEMWVETESNGEQDTRSQKVEGRTSNRDDKVLIAPKIVKKMKLKFSRAWLSFIRLPLPLDVYKEVLVTLHQTVIPHLSNPIMLCDFLTRSYDIGGVVSVMALSSLFILMTQHGLEYPNFYDKLYALLQPSIFMAKHRAKFLELLDSCLKSPLLPAYLAASFAKKLSRLALSTPPSGALVIIAVIHNLLRRHPSINCLVHWEDVDIDAKEQKETLKEGPGSVSECSTAVPIKPALDSFCNEEVNPMKTNAMRSSLWEIDTLRHHYCPPVSRFVLSLENDLTVRAKTTEINVKDFTSGSYATIFGDEMRRRVKQVPLAFYKTTPTSLFSESDFPRWTFHNKLDESNFENGENGTNNDDEKSAKRPRIGCS